MTELVTRYGLVVLMMAVGAFNALQAPINASLSRRAGLVAAVTVAFLVGLLIMLAMSAVTRSDPRAAWGAPWWQYLGALTAVTFILATAFLVTRIGLAAVISANVAGQLLMGMLLDRFGLLGLERIPISWVRVLGGVLLLAGSVMVARK